jgi:ATP-grasp domain-containing protein
MMRSIDVLVCPDGFTPTAAVACEGGSDAELVSARLGCPIQAFERRLGLRRPWTSADVADALQVLGDGSIGSETTVFPYAASRELAAWAGQRGVLVLAPDARLKYTVDDKLRTRRALERRRVPVPEHFAGPASALSFAEARARVGLPFVVQALHGSGGVETWLVREPSDLRDIDAAPGDAVLVSRYAGELTFNVNAAVTVGAVAVAAPSLQAAGIPELVRTSARYCGNDFSLVVRTEPAVVAAAVGLTRRVGEWLRRLGFRGIFGVDLAFDGITMRVLEVNPRLQGSTWLLCELERRAGRRPLGDVHAAAWIAPREAPGHAAAYEHEPLDGACLVLGHLGSEPLRLSARAKPGVYRVEGSRLLWRGAGVSPVDCKGDQEFVIGSLPDPGVSIARDGVLARVSAPFSLLRDSSTLSTFGRFVTRAVRAAFFEESKSKG